MERRATAFFFLLLVIIGMATYFSYFHIGRDTLPITPAEYERTIRICLCLDTKKPPNEALVNKYLDIVFREYLDNVYVRFVISERIKYRGNINHKGLKQRAYLERIRTTLPDYWLIITDQRLRVKLDENSFLNDKGIDTNIYGYAETTWKYIIIGNFSELCKIKDRGGNKIAPITIRHELGHIFVGHIPNPASFMQVYPDDGISTWTPETIHIIKLNKFWDYE